MVRGPRRPGAPRLLAPLGFAGPSHSIAAELLWRYAGPAGPLFFLSHFDDTVLTGVGLDSATKLELVERPRDSAGRGIGAHSSRIQRALGGCTARPGPIGVDLDS